jgi:hypothetical protein
MRSLAGYFAGVLLFVWSYIAAISKSQKAELKQEVYEFVAYQRRKQEKAKNALTFFTLLAMFVAPIIGDIVENHHSTKAFITASIKASSDKGQPVEIEPS